MIFILLLLLFASPDIEYDPEDEIIIAKIEVKNEKVLFIMQNSAYF